MKVKLHETLPLQIAVELRARLHDVQTVWEEGLSGHADLDIWEPEAGWTSWGMEPPRQMRRVAFFCNCRKKYHLDTGYQGPLKVTGAMESLGQSLTHFPSQVIR